MKKLLQLLFFTIIAVTAVKVLTSDNVPKKDNFIIKLAKGGKGGEGPGI